MITLSMIVKNEEEYLSGCLNSVKNVVDEIVIVDTGSTDSTVEIAKRFGAKVFMFDWANDFSAARNFALEHSTGDWILYLDADERLSAKSVDELKRITGNERKSAYYCKIVNVDEVNNRPSVMEYVRLFPNDKSVRFEGRIHEQIENSLKRENYSLKKSNIEIIHVGYSVSKEKLKEKAKRNLELLLNQYAETPTAYYAYQLGQTYGILKDKPNAEKFFLTALQTGELNNEYRGTANRYLAINCAERGELEKAFNYINASLTADKTQPISLIAAAKIYLQLGKNSAVKQFIKEAYSRNEDYLSGKLSSSQSILLDEQTIVNEGISIAVRLSDGELFNYFYSKTSKLVSNGQHSEFNLKAELFNKLFNNEPVEDEDIKKYSDILNDESNVETILNLMDFYSNNELKLIMLKKLYNNFPGNTSVINKLAFHLRELQDYEQAEQLLEKSFSINNDDPAMIFYLVSVYLSNGSFDKIQNLISYAEEKFGGDEIILQRLTGLKEKLLNSIN